MMRLEDCMVMHPASSLTSQVCNWLIGRWECCQTGHGTLAANVTWMICVTVVFRNAHMFTLCVCFCVCSCSTGRWLHRVGDRWINGYPALVELHRQETNEVLVQVPLCAQIWDRTWASRKRPVTNRHSHVMALASSSNRWSQSRERS